jgi:hypothetical protein
MLLIKGPICGDDDVTTQPGVLPMPFTLTSHQLENRPCVGLYSSLDSDPPGTCYVSIHNPPCRLERDNKVSNHGASWQSESDGNPTLQP